jgi:hypothetical protein
MIFLYCLSPGHFELQAYPVKVRIVCHIQSLPSGLGLKFIGDEKIQLLPRTRTSDRKMSRQQSAIWCNLS